jgi:D-apiose dehydrogenase
MIGIGLLGCGRISENHLVGYRDPEDLGRLGDVIALCDSNEEALRRQATRHEVPVRYTRLDNLIADRDVQVVAVLTPPDIRCEVVLPLLEAGKHVLVEKPFAHTYEEARRMVDAAARHNRVLAVNQNYRWRADTLKLKELIDDGAIGTVVGLHQLHAMWRDEGPGWRRTTDYLAMAVMAVHWLDRFRWLAGDEAASVYTAARSTGLLQSKGEDWAAMTVKFRGGAIGHCTEDWCSATRHKADTFVVDGTTGSLVAERSAVTRYGRETGDEQRHEVGGEFPATFAHSMRLVLEAVASGTEPSISGRDNLKTIALLDGCYRSAATGEAVHLDEEGLPAASTNGAARSTGAAHGGR